MVYCSLKERLGDVVIYLFGGYIDDMSGEVSYNIHSGEMMIKKQPVESSVRESHLKSVFNVNRKDFLNGIFRGTLAREV